MKRLETVGAGGSLPAVSGHSHKDVKARVPKLPPFEDSRENIEDYLQRFERYSVSVGWAREDWALHLSALLKGKALAVYSRLSPEQATDYDNLKEALYKRFQLSEEGFRKKFRNSIPEGGETPSQFAARIEHYLLRWMELGRVDLSFEGLQDLVVREQFYSSCGKNLGMFLREKRLRSIEEVTDQAEQYIEAHGYGEFVGKRNAKVEPLMPFDSSEREKSKLVGNQKRCYGCGNVDHQIKDCKFVGHKAAYVSEEPVVPEGNQYQNSGRGYNVRGRGRSRGGRRGYGHSHYRNNDSKDRKETETAPPVGCCVNRDLVDFNYECSLPKMSAAYQSPVKDTGAFGKMPTAEGFVGGKKVTALRDTGCSGVVVRRDLVTTSELTGAVQHCVLVDGTVRKFPKALIDVQCPFYTGKTEALCVERPVYPLIIGNIPGLRESNYDSFDFAEKQNKETKDVSKSIEGVPKQSEGTDKNSPDSKAETHTSESETMVQVSAVQTRSQKEEEKKGKTHSLTIPSPIEAVSRDDMKLAQENDGSLVPMWELAKTGEKKTTGKFNSFWYLVHNGLLYRKFESPNCRSVIKQLVVPKPYREYVMKLGHEGLLAGHLGYKKCADKILTQFHWPGVLADVKRYCQSCAICQRTSPKGKVCKAPLGDMPIIDTPFQRVAVDLIGPISPSSDRGHRYILTVVDFATRYPEACPLKTIETEDVAEALVQIFCRVGFPREVLSDRGSQFLSGLMAEVSRLLSIKQLFTSPYHPSCNGLVEKMNGTLKAMIKKLCSERPTDWDRYVTPALFAYREAPQASTGFSPFELIYGWKVRGPLEILREVWTKELESDEVRTVYQYVLDLRDRLEETLGLAHQELAKSKERYKGQYNKKARMKNVKVGDKVLILLPTKSNKLLLQWKGPYEVEEKLGDIDFRVKVNGKLKTFHANMVKKFFERAEPVVGLIQNVCAAIVEEDDLVETKGELVGEEAENFEFPNLVQKETVEQVKINPELTEKESSQLKDLLIEFKDVLTDLPGKTHLIEHEIRLTTDEPIRSRPYPIPHALKEVVEKEIQSMKDMGIIEPSDSPYSSPIVLVKKSDGSYRFCADMRKVNQATIFDAEPMPDPEEIFSKLSKCKYFSKIDLSKGYWQIPMSEKSKKFTSFATSTGLWQFRRMPFGLVTAPSSFSRMMRKLLEGLEDLDNFLDDILIFTVTWEAHVEALGALFERLRSACLTARPSKCLLGFPDLEFLGHNVGDGCLKPVSTKVKSIEDAPRPRTKKGLRSFLGVVGFYRKFISNFACRAVPLTDLTRKGCPNVLQWEEAQENSFQNLKKALTCSPILRLPDLQKSFILRTDASQFGIGSVLLQEWSDGKFPIAYASRKLLPREVNYAVIEKECLAIIWAVQKFHQYLCGVEFTLETDHAPLLYLNKSKVSNSRIMRWALILQSYRFHIVAIKGSDNVGADYMSRLDQ